MGVWRMSEDYGDGPHSESNIQSRTRLAAVKKRWRLWRNNRGAGKLDNGSFVRWGLANDSKKIGDVLKSGDLIGWRPVIITPGMVGKLIAQFVSVEVKSEDWTPPPLDTKDEAAAAQYRWAELVNREGGYAVFVNDPNKL
jgi:hypothetical protein